MERLCKVGAHNESGHVLSAGTGQISRRVSLFKLIDLFCVRATAWAAYSFAALWTTNTRRLQWSCKNPLLGKCSIINRGGLHRPAGCIRAGGRRPTFAWTRCSRKTAFRFCFVREIDLLFHIFNPGATHFFHRKTQFVTRNVFKTRVFHLVCVAAF